MVNYSSTENAVSPVIGTILLVAITVILVAIVASVVMPMASGVGNAHIVGIQVSSYHVSDSDKGVDVSFVSGDLSQLKDISVQGFDGSDSFEFTPAETYSSYSVGPCYRYSCSGSEAVVTVVGTFKDGSSQVLYNGELEF